MSKLVTSSLLLAPVSALLLALSAGSASAADPKPADKAKPADPKAKAGDKAKAGAKASKNPVVIIKTNLGTIKAELFEDKAPETVKNFLSYVADKHYDGTIFHRVIKGFMIQGGGFDQKMSQKATKPPVKNEAANGLKNEVGTLAMARTNVPDSATSQFFINTVNNVALDFRDPSAQGIGYCVFGKVLEGMDTVTKISDSPTGVTNGMRDVPQKPVIIESVRLQK